MKKISNTLLQNLKHAEIQDDFANNPKFAAIVDDIWKLHDNGLSLSTLFDELKDDPDAYIYDETDLEEFLEIYDN